MKRENNTLSFIPENPHNLVINSKLFYAKHIWKKLNKGHIILIKSRLILGLFSHIIFRALYISLKFMYRRKLSIE